MKIGIVGTGKIAKELLGILSGIQGIECNAICGTVRSKEEIEKLCCQYKISCGVTDYKTLLAADIDTVYIALPNHLHYQYSLEALRENKNVIVEKPMTCDDKQAMEIISLAKEKKLFLFEAISNQYMNNYKKIKEWIPQLGEVKLVQCNFSQYSSRYDAFISGQLPPVFDPAKAGGTLMDINIYNIHYITGLFGIPQDVKYYANMERGIDTSGVLMMNYSGFQAVCIAAKDSASPARNIIQGTKGYIIQNSPSNICGEVILHLNDGTEQIYDGNKDSHRMVPEFTEFTKHIESGDQRLCYKMLEHSLWVSKIVYDARLSAGIRF